MVIESAVFAILLILLAIVIIRGIISFLDKLVTGLLGVAIVGIIFALIIDIGKILIPYI